MESALRTFILEVKALSELSSFKSFMKQDPVEEELSEQCAFCTIQSDQKGHKEAANFVSERYRS